MAKFVIHGGKPLSGKIMVSGAKNAALKMIAASILASKPITLRNVPRISDVDVMLSLVGDFGVKASWSNHNTLVLDPKNVRAADPNPILVKKLRASFVLAGPALARFGRITIPTPGGDKIGKRPLDTHIEAFEQMLIKIKRNKNKYEFNWPKKINSTVYLSEISVTGTENALLASILGNQETIICGAATEPEIGNLIDLLNNAGADIKGKNTSTLQIKGVPALGGGEMKVIPDRIETGTLLMAGLITKGNVTVKNINPDHSSYLIPKLRKMGAEIKITGDTITAKYKNTLRAINVDTRTYPGFYSDLQSPMATLMTQAIGKSTIFETLYESRFNYIKELKAMGAKIAIVGPHIINIIGPAKLHGKHIMAGQDIRACGALILTGLAAKGKTTIENIDAIDRGYENLNEKLKQLGAKIERID